MNFEKQQPYYYLFILHEFQISLLTHFDCLKNQNNYYFKLILIIIIKNCQENIHDYYSKKICERVYFGIIDLDLLK